MKKGVTYSLEALIAVTIVVTSMMIAFGGLQPQQRPGLTLGQENAFSCVRALDYEGRLRGDAVVSNTTNVTNNLRGCIRGQFNETVQICKGACTALALDRTKEIAAAKYYLAGANSTSPTLVIVYIWTLV